MEEIELEFGHGTSKDGYYKPFLKMLQIDR